jgi:hypothetical protein
MKFLVRDLKNEKNPNPDIVGLLFVEDAVDLFMTMDEWDNPHHYEYLKITGSGGVLTDPFREKEKLSVSEEWASKAIDMTDEFPEDKPPKWKKFSELLDVPFETWYRDVFIAEMQPHIFVSSTDKNADD